MANKKDSVVLGIVFTAAVCYVASRLWKTKKQEDFTLEKGTLAFKEKNYQMALSFLLSVESPDFEVFRMISECHIKLGNPANSLKYLDKCISLKKSEELLKTRFQIHSSLGLNKEAFKDLFLINLLNENDVSNKEKANDFLKKICLNLTKTHKIQGMASPVNYSDFFDTLIFLEDEQDPVVVFLNSREYEKCYNFVVESEVLLHKLVLGCFYLINGDQGAAIKILEKLNNVYAAILIKFIRSKKLTKEEIEDVKSRAKVESDPTILLYCAKIFENIGDSKSQHESLQRCISMHPNACATCSLIVMHIKQGNYPKAVSLIKTGIKEYPECINLVCIALEYFLLKKEVEEATKVMEMSEKLFPNDPRLFIFKYMISEVLGNPDTSFLMKGISIDPKYFKLYIYLGNTSITGEQSSEAYHAALKCSRTFDEIFAAYQLLIVIETQNELFKEFPELFTKKS